VVATAGFRPGDRLHRRLRGYKDAPTAEARAACADRLASMVGSWMADHPAHLRDRFGPGWEAVCPVPSSARPGTPVDALVARVPELARCGRALLVRGPAPTGHLRADRRGFELAGSVDPGWLAGRRVLVFDDAVVTGARAQSAAAALRSAGARVVGVLAAGRAAPR
jgi:predicted amidophosphoribosyltransferase